MDDDFEAYWTFVVVYPGDVTLSGPARAFIELTKEAYC